MPFSANVTSRRGWSPRSGTPVAANARPRHPPEGDEGSLYAHRREFIEFAAEPAASSEDARGSDEAVAPLRRLSRSSSEPRCTSAPAAASDLALASARARPRTWCPASIDSRTIAEPMNPVAPVTKTRMLNVLLEEDFRRVNCTFVGVSQCPSPHG